MRIWARAIAPVALAVSVFCMALPAEAAPCAYTGGPAVVAVEGRPFAAEASPDGCWLFAGLLGDGKGAGGAVAVFRNAGGRFEVAATVPAPGDPTGVAVSGDGRTLAVAAGGAVLLFDIPRLTTRATAALAATVPLGPGSGAVYVAISPDGKLLAVSEEERDTLALVDLARARLGEGEKAIIGRVRQGRGPVGLAFSRDGSKLYATNQIAPDAMALDHRCDGAAQGGKGHSVGLLVILDVARAVKHPEAGASEAVAVGCNPVRVALSPDGAVAWVTTRGDDRLVAVPIRGQAAKPIALKVGSAPVGVAARPDGRQVWVANSDRFSPSGEGSLTMTRTDGGPGRTEPSGRFPRDLRFLPDGRTLVVAQFGSRAIQFVPTEP